MIFNNFIRDNAERLGVKGFVRHLEDGRMEVFIEGDTESVEKMAPLCRRGPQHSMIKNVEEKEERFQDFKEFKVLSF